MLLLRFTPRFPASIRAGPVLRYSLPISRYSSSRAGKELKGKLKDQNTLTSETETKVDVEQSKVEQTKASESISKLSGKAPGFLKSYFETLKNAPLTNLSSFVILHELSAIIPLGVMWYVFHKFHIVPSVFSTGLMESGMKYVQKVAEHYNMSFLSSVASAERGQILMEGAAAYSIVKVLLVPRMFVSLLLTPWFSRVILSRFLLGQRTLFAAIGRLFSRKKPSKRG